MYLLGGEFKGLKLVSPAQIRPTESRVREAIFDILGQTIENARVLDAFAGSGALGLEALSRGAAFVAFLDDDPEAIVAIRDNLARLEGKVPRSAWRVVQLDIYRGMPELADPKRPFDVVLMDPPYGHESGKKALISVGDCAMLAPSGVVAVEHDQRSEWPEAVGPLRAWKQHRYGDTVLSFYRLAQGTW